MESIRRRYLNYHLSNIKLYGKVIDVGGKKINKRFDPKLDKSRVTEFIYLNTDKSTSPDIEANAERIPFKKNYFDIVLMIEVLEHLENPLDVLFEIKRILKINGQFYFSIPFIYPVHADPYDFQRWTSTKIKKEIERVGFSEIEIISMGGLMAVINDLIRFEISKQNNLFIKRLFSILYSSLLLPFSLFLDKLFSKSKDYSTTGYFIKCKKL